MTTTPVLRTTDQLRADIDSGKAGDKIAFPDPAAAPLGTDDEAAGQPPTAGQLRLAVRYELGNGKRQKTSIEGFPFPYLVIALLVAVAVLAAVWLGMSHRG